MADVKVQTADEGDPYRFVVTIQEGGSQTQHQVTLRQPDYERLSGGKSTPEGLVEESFRFLLEHESKESILRTFDLTVIGRYFSSYEREIRGRL